MSTNIRADISEKNKYWIEPHKYYELKHFCLQYPSWIKTLDYISNSSGHRDFNYHEKGKAYSNPTENVAIQKVDIQTKIDLVNNIIDQLEESLKHFVFLGVTEGLPYVYLRNVMHIPCGKDKYYEEYRKFFWLLSLKR